MTREVSRRLSYDPVLKGATRPDRVGERRLDEKIVEDRDDPAERAMRGREMDDYLGKLNVTEGVVRLKRKFGRK
jgi:hypothetical protein